MRKNVLYKFFYIFFIISLFIAFSNYDFSAVVRKAAQSESKLKVGKSQKKVAKKSVPKVSQKQSVKKTQLSKASKAKVSSKYSVIVEIDSVILDGIRYKKVTKKFKKYKNSYHILEIDLKKDSLFIEVLKAKGHFSAIENLIDMINFRNKIDTSSEIVAGVNANFWRAYTNFPIGILVSNGEIISLKSYKNWSSCFFDEKNLPYIDVFSLYANLDYGGVRINIDYFNRRVDSGDVVVYNRFAGNQIPFISDGRIEEIVADALKEMIFVDSTEQALDTTKLIETILQSKKEAMFEYTTYKVALRFIDELFVNRATRCVVDSVCSSSMNMPKNGFIVSFGKNENYPAFKIGDTLLLKVQTNKYQDVVFKNAVSGTPRLVRDGRARPEVKEEEIKSKKFIYSPLQRTAVGFNKDKSRLFLVCCENSGNGKKGVSLGQLAEFMRSIGCYQAMNLDGGGSVSMVVNGVNVLRSNNNSLRKISAGIGIGKIR